MIVAKGPYIEAQGAVAQIDVTVEFNCLVSALSVR